MSAIGVVTIGRNEGERLRRCLDALVRLGPTVVYVDSGSDDGSVALAASRGVEVVNLDMSAPFSAARARNAGFERLLQVDPGVRLVQFLDGDCEVIDGWLEAARRALDDQPRAAVVFGLLRERSPERSIFNRVADIDWSMQIRWGRPRGEAKACGGIAMMRADAFREVGGFNPSLPAAEEPELCQRLHQAGWSVEQLGTEMAWHDSAIMHFGQWWRRQFRTGYGGMDFSTRFGRGRDDPFRKILRGAWIWAVGWPLAVASGGALGASAGGWAAGLATAALVALVLPAQMARVALKVRPLADSPRAAVAYGVLTTIGKWAQVAGHLAYLRDRHAGRHARLIEYKHAGAAIHPSTTHA